VAAAANFHVARLAHISSRVSPADTASCFGFHGFWYNQIIYKGYFSEDE
jgi:hypothetical protein